MAGTIYLERTDKKKMLLERAVISVILIALSFFLYLILADYSAMPNPNASECMAGFADTGCPEGFVCRGMLVECEETNAEFRHFFTNWFFDKPVCRAERIYREVCVEKKP